MFVSLWLATRAAASIIVVSGMAANAAEPSAGNSAATQPSGGHGEGAFILSWDADGDGKVPRAEYEAVRVERFASADENRDGALNAAEYVNEYALRLDREVADERTASIKQTHTRFRALDKDEDNFVSRAEYDASGVRAFEKLDQDRDGRITQQDPEGARSETAAGAQPRRRSVIAMPSTHRRTGLLEIYDADGDGVVTREQYQSKRAETFAATDANRDGKLDREEYVNEFAARLERQIQNTRQTQLQQGQVRFKSIDADHDGAIGRNEYAAMSARVFERADTNRDSVVSAEDPAPVREQRGEEPSS
jgi:Ca2+-binding EF-hand superfamily protein